MNTQMHANIAQTGCKKTPSSSATKPRRASYYTKKGRQGRRTKLTGLLLRAITEIIAETEILSISHLSQELAVRGHSMSRSTVFRAMEVLGLRVDRDRKVWCAGPARAEPGPDATRGTKHDASASINEGFTKLQTNSTTANTFSGGPEDIPTLTVSNLSYPKQMGYFSSNVQRADDHVSSTDVEIPEKGRLYTVTHSHSRQSKRETDDSLNLVSQEFAWIPCTGSRESVLLADKWTATTKDKEGLKPINMTSLNLSQRKGRKRKSDCPTKFGAFNNSEGCADTPYWPTIAPPASSNGRADEKLKGSTSVEQQAEKTLPLILKLLPKNTGIHAPSNRSVNAKETSSSSPGVYELGSQDQGRPQGLQKNQAQKLPTVKLPIGFQRRAESPVPSRTSLTQSSSGDSLILEPEACDNRTSVSGKTDSMNGASSKLHRSVLDHEVAGFVEWNDSKFVLRDRRLVGTTLKDDHMPSLNLQDSGTDPPLQKSTLQSQRSQKASSSQLPHDSQREGMHKDVGYQLLRQSSAANGELNPSSNSRHVKASDGKWSVVEANHRSRSERHLGKQSREAGHLPAGDGDTAVVNSIIPGFQNDSLQQNRLGETDPQTARLHALTSSLAAKTSTIFTKKASSQDLQIKMRATDEKLSDKLLPDLYSNKVNRKLSVDRNHTIGSGADNDPRVTQTRQKAFSKSSIPPANKYVASDCQQSESIPSSQTTCGAVNTPASSCMNCFSTFLPELKSWMQDVSTRLNSMENQLQYLTQGIPQPKETMEEAEHNKLLDEEEDEDRADEGAGEEKDGDRAEEEAEEAEEAGETDEDEAVKAEEEEMEPEVPTWNTTLPYVNTPESNDLINKLLSDERWSCFSPYIGGPRLAIRLARDCIFGSKILSRSTVTGRNGMKPLQRDGVKKIKDCLMQIYGPKCSDVERDILWKMARESLSQLCKRTRRQFTVETNDNAMEEQA